MTSLVSTSDVNALGAGGGLGDTDLQSIIDREEAEMVRRFGAHTGSRAETVHGGTGSIYLKRAISSITSISEYLYLGDPAPLTLVATDYYVWSDEGRIQRLYGGYAPFRWGPMVIVTYTPVDQSDLRKQVLIELVRLATNQDTGASISGLGYSISGGPKDTSAWQASREALYARLAGPGDR